MLSRIARFVDHVLADVPFYPFFFTAAAVLPLWVTNFGEAPMLDMVVLLLVVLVATAIGYGLAWVAYRDARRAAIVVACAAVIFLKLGQISTALNAIWSIGGFVMLLVGLAVVVFIGLAAAKAKPKMMASLTQAANIASVLLLGFVSIPLVGFAGDALAIPDDLALGNFRPVESTSDAGVDGAPQRDIYYLVLDRYGSERALLTGHDISNTGFVAWLRDRDFAVVDDARANYVSTILSLGSSLSMASLDDIAERIGPDNRVLAPVVGRLRHSRAATFLQDQGYEYIHVGTWYDPTRVSDIADRSFAPEAHESLMSVALDSSALGVLLNTIAPERAFEPSHAASADYQFELLDQLIAEPGPKFVVAHILMPHPPYVFLEDGSYAPDEATFESQLRDTNARLRNLISKALDEAEAELPIIILQADEGPYPARYERDPNGFDWAEATDDELVTKFGILSAMHLPGRAGAADLPSPFSPVNTFREVLRRYFGADLPNEPDRSYASPYSRPYDLIDITDRLAVPPSNDVPGVIQTGE
jgi:hypothetical protein